MTFTIEDGGITLEITKQILITLFSYPLSHGTVTRRDISTVLFICSNLFNDNTEIFDIFPDGVESEKINLYVDYLLVKGLVDVEEGKVSITENGKQYAQNILTNPDNRIYRILFRVSREIWLLSREIRTSLALYLYFKTFNSNIRGFAKIRNLYRELKDYVSVFLEKEEKPVQKRKVDGK